MPCRSVRAQRRSHPSARLSSPTIWSTKPMACAFFAEIGLPITTIGKRRLCADHARQALRSAAPGIRPSFTSRQAHFGRWHRNPVMTGQGNFTAPAQMPCHGSPRQPVCRWLPTDQSPAQIGLLHRLAKFGNIRAGKKRPSVTADNHRFNLIVGQCASSIPSDKSLAYSRAQAH